MKTLNKLLSISFSITKIKYGSLLFCFCLITIVRSKNSNWEKEEHLSGQTRFKKKKTHHEFDKISIVLWFSLSSNEVCDCHHPSLDYRMLPNPL